VKVPSVRWGFVTNVAPWPSGRRERSAVSAAIGSPSGSEAVTTNDSVAASAPAGAGGALTTGARSAFATVIVVVAWVDCPLAAVNVTG
jgi:hypothetical protein